MNQKDVLSNGGKIGGRAKGPDYQVGGTAPKGFASNPEFARAMGRIGGKISKRGIKRPKVQRTS